MRRDSALTGTTEMCESEEDKKSYVESYQSFAYTLRTWLVAYGIGAPVLFASQECFQGVLNNRSQARLIIIGFLVGVVIQIAAALIYKTAMWYVMFGCLKPTFKSTWRYAFSDWISEQLWLELLFDVTSITAFVWATYKTLMLLFLA